MSETISERSHKSKLYRKTRQSDYSECTEPSIPVVQPIVHASTYRVNSVEHFQQVVSKVGILFVLNNHDRD